MTTRKHAIIYVPGLGDAMVTGQRLALQTWRLSGVEPYLFQMHWASQESFEVKLARLIRLIDRLHEQGKVVSLAGASAGASAVLHAYAARPRIINGVACICGKIQNGLTVSDGTYRHNPPFKTAMAELPRALSTITTERRRHIISAKPLADITVPPADTLLPGALSVTLPVTGHVLGIAYGLTLGSGRLIRFLKQQVS